MIFCDTTCGHVHLLILISRWAKLTAHDSGRSLQVILLFSDIYQIMLISATGWPEFVLFDFEVASMPHFSQTTRLARPS